MFETTKIIDVANQFTNPIAKFAHYLLTNPVGYTILIILSIYFIVSEIGKGLNKRKFYKSGGQTIYVKISFIETIFFGVLSLLKGVFNLIYKTAVLICIYLFLNLIVNLDHTLKESSLNFKKQKDIQDFNILMKQISKPVNIAEIKVDNVDFTNFPDIHSSLKIRYYDLTLQAFRTEVQQIEIAGGELFLDVRQLNFEYSIFAQPEKGVKFTTKIYSEMVSQEKGIKLQYIDNEGMPYYLKKKENDYYGLTKNEYINKTKTLLSWLVPTNESKINGIRSFNLNPLHKKLNKGEVITIQIDQNGEIMMTSNWMFTPKDKTKQNITKMSK